MVSYRILGIVNGIVNGIVKGIVKGLLNGLIKCIVKGYRMRTFKKIATLVMVNLVVFLVLLEIISLAIYFFKHKAFYYTHQREAVPAIETRGAIETAEGGQLTNKRFHPFFGYTHRAGLKNTNNYGFNCSVDYPLKKENKNWYIIGIFGGSVAEDFFNLGRARLEEKLKEHTHFAGKEIVFLNFAMGGYKQPQQMQILTYFQAAGQELDMAVNIDGFNEMIFCFNNNRLNVDIAMPSAQHFLPMRDLVDKGAVTDEKLQAMWRIREIKKNYIRTGEKLKNTPLASLHLIYSAYNDHLFKTYRGELIRFDALIKPTGATGSGEKQESLINIKYTPATTSEPALMAEVVSLWYRSSRVMSSVMEAGGGRYYHFLQPNQYYSKKPFTPQETKLAITPEHPYNMLVKKGFPVFETGIGVLKKQNIAAFSGVEIFDNVKESIYIDACCHFNELGNNIFADFIAVSILKSF